MRGTALSLRLRRAFIPAYVNANVKKCNMGEEELKYPCLLPILSPRPYSIPRFSREKQAAINLTKTQQIMMPDKERLCRFESFCSMKQLNTRLSI